MKKILKMIAIVIVTLITLSAIGIGYLLKDLKAMESVTPNPILQQQVEDGEYIGNYTAGRFSNSVKVVIKNQKIVSIELLKPVTFERSEVTAELFNQVIEFQSTEIDTISAATATSIAYLKSIEGALNP